ncbi:hypothetical protein [Roseovarius indicus]|uniref:hypothetical protein n=1 Tax=Roseovarius indicus TaxID=540747 RepID=UPI0032EEFF89
MHQIRRSRARAPWLALVASLGAGSLAAPALAECDEVETTLTGSASLDEVKDWVRAEGADRIEGTPTGTYEYFDEGVALWLALSEAPDGRICGRYGGRYFDPERTFQSHVVLGGQLSNGAWEITLADRTGTVKTGYGAMLLFDSEDLVLADGAVIYADGQRFALMRPVSALEASEGSDSQSAGSGATE